MIYNESNQYISISYNIFFKSFFFVTTAQKKYVGIVFIISEIIMNVDYLVIQI